MFFEYFVCKHYLTYQLFIKIIIMTQYDELKNMQSKIFQQIQRYQQLRTNYNDCAGQKFLKFLTRIMTVMSAKIKKAQNRFQNIDQQIDSDDRCQYLFKQNRLYELQTINMLAQLQRIDMQLQQTKAKNQTIKQQIKEIRNNFYNKSKSCVKYTRKAVSIENAKTKLDKFLNNSTNQQSVDNFEKDIEIENQFKSKKKRSSNFGYTTELPSSHKNNSQIFFKQQDDWVFRNNKTQYRKFFQHKYRKSYVEDIQKK